VDRVLLIANSRAGSVSARTKEVIVKALSADFKLEAVDTAARGHASDLARQAVADGYDAVLAFGGDGTINEATQGVAETDVPLGLIPGGTTNVLARSLGLPRDPVEATAYVASRLRTHTTRRINLGRFNGRYFVFSAGLGLDAEVVKRVERDPEAKRRNSDRLFLRSALNAGFTKYRGMDPAVTLHVDGAEPERVLFAICCNGRPFTYYKRFPVDAVPRARLDGGLDFLALTKIHATTIPRIVWGVFVSRSHPNWRISRYHHDVAGASIEADEPMPVQVDGDYIGEESKVRIDLVPNALELLV
jgi:diacylglycerol kinase family enzyme